MLKAGKVLLVIEENKIYVKGKISIAFLETVP
jgi:hypothetical protein